jgi:mRNA-degrading endonuclease toxin of MazEF toxin-antitoxin module
VNQSNKGGKMAQEKTQENRIERGDIFFVYLDPAFGREIGGYKRRPVVVVSTNDIHQKTRIVAVVPGTTTPFSAPNIVAVRPDSTNGLKEPTYFQCHQIRAVDQGRMTSRPEGRIAREHLMKIENAIAFSIGVFIERESP